MVTQAIQKIVTYIEESRQLVLSSNYIINIILAGSLHQLWTLIRSQQIIVLIPLQRISMPANAGIFYNLLM